MCLLLTLSRCHTWTQVNAHCVWLFLLQFSCVSYIYLHGQQKQLLSHTKIDGTGGGGGGRGSRDGSNNSIDMILFCDFHQSSSGNNNLRDMILSYDSINRRFHHISPNNDSGTLIEDNGERKILEPFCCYSLVIQNYTLNHGDCDNIGKNPPVFCTLFLSGF